MFKKKLSSIIILLILSSVYLNVLYAQRIDSLLAIMETKYPQEKIHVQFDKLYYNAGKLSAAMYALNQIVSPAL